MATINHVNGASHCASILIKFRCWKNDGAPLRVQPKLSVKRNNDRKFQWQVSSSNTVISLRLDAVHHCRGVKRQTVWVTASTYAQILSLFENIAETVHGSRMLSKRLRGRTTWQHTVYCRWTIKYIWKCCILSADTHWFNLLSPIKTPKLPP